MSTWYGTYQWKCTECGAVSEVEEKEFPADGRRQAEFELNKILGVSPPNALPTKGEEATAVFECNSGKCDGHNQKHNLINAKIGPLG